jgi:anti-anti-sigma factor
MELELEIVSLAGVAVVRCRGRLIYGPEAAELLRTMRQLLDTTRQVVLQFADLTQIDSGGVGTLGAAFMAAHNRQAEIKLAAVPERVHEVLRITGLAWLFQTLNGEAEAIRAFTVSSEQDAAAR